MEKLFNILFTPICEICGQKIGTIICQECLIKCRAILETNCIICEQPSLFGVTHSYCAELYSPKTLLCIYKNQGVVKRGIKISKYNAKRFCTLKQLAESGIEEILKSGYQIDKKVEIVPIPISKEKLKERGFNQAELIAKVISQKTSAKINNSALERIKETTTQATKAREERFINLQGAFKAKKVKKTKEYLLVDDICTTGATFLEASKVLYEAGAKNVHCLALAKTKKRKAV